jgi:NAD-dependent SIR2 family protein deacetylase
VYPAAGLPQAALSRGAEIVIVNNMPTPLDKSAVLHFDDLGEVFGGLQNLLQA